MNDPSIYENHKSLYNNYFSKYENYTIVEKGNFTINNNEYYTNKSFKYPLMNNELDSIKTLLKINKNSYKNNGKIEVLFNNDIIGSIDVYMKKDTKKEKGNLLKKLFDLFS